MAQRTHIKPGDRLPFSLTPSKRDLVLERVFPAPVAVAPATRVPSTPTAKQGQYLAFIYYYTKIHGIPPAEADFLNYFRVSPPSVHQMILTLASCGFIERTPGQARSIRLCLSREALPDLE